MAHILSFMKGLAVGTGAAFLFDPQRGATRRANLRRQVLELGADLGDEVDRAIAGLGRQVVEQAHHASHAVLGEHCQIAEQGEGSCPWKSRSRLLVGTAGSLLLVYGLARRRPLARLATALGLGLLAEGLIHHSTSEPQQPEPSRHHEEPGTVSPARGQAEDTGASWKVAVP